VLDHIQDTTDDTTDDDGEVGNNSPDIDVAQRTWTAAEIAEQIQILARAAGVDWREELEHALYTKARSSTNNVARQRRRVVMSPKV
jgi:hypothetical protein